MAETKKQELAKAQKQNERLMKMVAEERERVRGYAQITQLYSAYISILLEKLGTTIDKPVHISKTSVPDALGRLEARAMPTEDGWSLYCETVGEE